MKHVLNILAVFLVTMLYSCQKEKAAGKVRLKLAYEVIPEDFTRNLYYVDWQDTLGKSEGYLPERQLERPKEIWCVITNDKNDTLGYYKGLSTAQTSAYFQTTDSIVNLHFMVGLNMFSDKFDDDKTGKQYWEANRKTIHFRAIKANIRSGLRKRAEIELQEQ